MMPIFQQKEARSRDYALLLSNASTGKYVRVDGNLDMFLPGYYSFFYLIG